MFKKLFGSGPLSAILDLLEFHINKMIELQTQEDAALNPPDFQQKVEAYELTAIFKGNEDLRQKIKEKQPEGFDFDAENMAEIEDNLQNIIELMGLEPPSEWVFEYPFKTERGGDLKSHFDGVSYCWDDLVHFPYLAREEKDRALQIIKNCLILLEKSFPDLVNSDLMDKATKAQHRFVIAASFFLKYTLKDIGLSNRSFIRHLRRRLRLWLKYQWRRLFAAPTR